MQLSSWIPDPPWELPTNREERQIWKLRIWWGTCLGFDSRSFTGAEAMNLP